MSISCVMLLLLLPWTMMSVQSDSLNGRNVFNLLLMLSPSFRCSIACTVSCNVSCAAKDAFHHMGNLRLLAS